MEPMGKLPCFRFKPLLQSRCSWAGTAVTKLRVRVCSTSVVGSSLLGVIPNAIDEPYTVSSTCNNCGCVSLRRQQAMHATLILFLSVTGNHVIPECDLAPVATQY